MTTPNLGLPEIIAAQAQPEVPIDQALRILDSVVMMAVASITNTPPGSPTDGERHIVDTSPTGAFVGHSHAIAYWVAGSFNEWRFTAPNAGWLSYVAATPKYWYYSGSAWVVTSII